MNPDDDSPKWFLMKQADGDVFGPMPFSQLLQWAVDACISPLDKVSSDGHTWVKAPMIPELNMDYLVEAADNTIYGPTTIGAIREFYADGEIQLESVVTNCKTGERKPLKDFPHQTLHVTESLQSRIRELEEIVLQERHLRQTAEHRVAELEKLLAQKA